MTVVLPPALWADCKRIAAEQGLDPREWILRRLRVAVDNYTTMGAAASAQIDYGF